MSTYVIGDVQGCCAELRQLLDAIEFSPGQDRLVMAGDLVNRGPDSLGVLRLLMELGPCVDSVLGNHDLHLLHLACIDSAQPRNKDTLDDILNAPDRDELVDWLRRRPLLIDPWSTGGDDKEHVIVHAGIPPNWTIQAAAGYAREAEQVLSSPDFAALIAQMYGNRPDRWDESLRGVDRWRYIINAFTRMRYWYLDGRLDFSEKGPPPVTDPALVPWFEVPRRVNRDRRIIFGHWSTLRLDPAEQARFRIVPLDTGCVWGGALTAYCLEDRRHVSVAALGRLAPA